MSNILIGKLIVLLLIGVGIIVAIVKMNSRKWGKWKNGVENNVGVCQKCGKEGSLSFFLGGSFSGGYYCADCYSNSLSKQKRFAVLFAISFGIVVAAFVIMLGFFPNFVDTLGNFFHHLDNVANQSIGR